MKLTKKLEAEILKIYNDIWDAYLKGDMRTFASILDEKCYIIGSAAGEVFSNKKSAVKYYKSTAEQITGKAEFRNRKIKVMPVEKGFMVNEESDFYLLIDDQWTFYGPARISSLFHKKNNKWKVIHQHGSFPDSKTEEGEQINTDKIKAENIQLRDAVKRRTIELENKNRELEIETALERVRAVAMSMRKPEELSGVGAIVFNKLKGLGFADLRNTEVIIINDTKETLTSYYYSDYGVTGVVEVLYKTNPTVKKWVKDLKKANNAFAEVVIHKNEIAAWRKYREAVGHKPDPKLNKAKEVYYYSYSIGSGGLSISTFKPASAEQIKILERFRNVFNLSYQRYIDIAKAEAQAKEARIELALERVRARAMAMQNSNELAELVSTVFNELNHLDFALTSCIIWIHDYELSSDTLWIASAEMNKPAKPFQVTPFHNGFFGSIIHAWKAKDPKWVYAFTGVEKKKFEKAFFKELPNLPDALKKALNVPKQVVFSASFNNFGGLEIVETEALTDEKFEILHRFGKVFDLSYTRFNDLKKAEAQVREAQVEAALERVRARAMAMHKSSELKDVARELRTQLGLLGTEELETCAINLYGESSDFIHALAATRLPFSQGEITESDFLFPKKGITIIEEILQAYSSGMEECVILNEGAKSTQWMNVLAKALPDVFAIVAESTGFNKNAEIRVWWTCAFFQDGSLIMITMSPPDDRSRSLLKRFALVFGMAYRRFADLKKAEAQAREAQIEAALERVRSRSMAMHHSNDLQEVIKVVTDQLLLLGFKFNTANFAKVYPDGSWDLWLSTPEQSYPDRIYVPYFDHKIFNQLNDIIAKGLDSFTDAYGKEEAKKFFRHFFENTIAKNAPESRKQFVLNSKGFARSLFLMKDLWLSIGNYEGIPYTAEENAVFKRFANVFEQAYTRFLDLQKAEAQAREADIELSLERVRAKTMAMQKPSEFVDVINIIGEQFVHLGFDIDWANFGANGFAISEGIDIWNFAVIPGASPISARVFIPYFDHPVFTNSAANINEFLNGGRDLITVTFDKQTKDTWLDHLFTKTIFKDVPQEYRVIQYAKSGYTTSNISIKDTWLSIGKFDSRPFTDEQHLILRRFANAFGQAYTRFLDLQKAEAQAREAQIEAGLERVRSRAMAMQTSEELRELIGTVFTELTKLDLVLTRCLIMIYDPKSNDSVWWMANSEAPTQPIGLKVQYHDHPTYLAYVNAWKQKELKWTYTLEGNTKKEWDDFLFVETELSHLPDFVIAGMKAPDRVYLNASFNSFGNLTLATLEPLSDEHFDIMLRFAKVFDLTYTRFNDLKQAEAQAREARIETALERVRAVAMAMRKPEDLMQISEIIYKQLQALDFANLRNVQIAIDDDEKKTYNGVEYSEFYQNRFKQVPYDSSPMFAEIAKEIKRSNNAFYQKEISGKEFEDWRIWRTNIKEREDSHIHPGLAAATSMCFYLHSVGTGMLGLSTFNPITDEQLDILKRFKNVFELSYRRYIDIEKAEAQVREAQIELALERVRARTMAMHKSEELAETAQVMFHQLQELGAVPDRIAIGVVDESAGVVNYWTTDQTGSHIDKEFQARLNERTVLSKTFQAWKDQKKSLVVDLHGDDVKEWIKFAREEMGVVVKDEFIKDRRVHSFGFYSHGWILVTTHEPQSAETIQILERFASVFNLTYRRFLDLQKAEAQANEARIEIALERIRARALAMHKSDELMEVAKVVWEQMTLLGQRELESSVVHLYEEDPDYIHSYRAVSINLDSNATLTYGHMAIPKNSCEVVREWLANFRSELTEYTLEISGAKQQEWYELLFKLAPDVVNSMRQKGDIHEKRFYRFSKFSGGALLMVLKQEPSEEASYLQRRAAVVFDLAYRRFSDLRRAEAQAKEAQIETALEKVRSRSLAMHKSDELQEVVDTVFERLQELNIDMASANIAIFKEGTRDFDYWIASPAQKRSAVFHLPYMDLSLTKDLIAARESGKEFSTTAYSFEEKNEWFEYAFKDTDFKFLSEERKQFILNAPAITVAIAFSKNTGVQVNRYNNKLYTEEEGEILKRFSKVFEQAYIRFLDLEKAEAQGREAQIEAALERVRSSSLAMHKSEELKDVVKIVFENFRSLGLQNIDSVNINIFHEGSRDFDLWLAAPGQDYTTNFRLPYLDHPIANDFFTAVKNGETIHKGIYDHDLKNKYFEYMFEFSDNKHLPEERKKLILNGRAYSVATGIAKHSSIFIHNYNGEKFSEETNGILVRFSKVFDQAYTRFLDLQKAEAQAREAQIEASLERVRSKTMAMHNSNDVGDTVAAMFAEFVHLGIHTNRCGILIFNDEATTEVWTARSNPEGKATLIIGRLDLGVHDLLMSVYQAWKRKESFHRYDLLGDGIIHYYEAINRSEYYPVKFELNRLPPKEFHSDFFFPEGAVFAFTREPIAEEHSKIFKRFAGVFGQTYRRYLDLLKAEAQAKEAQIEVSLERVRAKAMAMHSSKDLAETLGVFYRELKSLSVIPIRCGVALMDKETRMAELTTMNTTGEGDSIEIIGKIKMAGHPVLDGVFESWLGQKEYHAVLRGNQIKEYYQVLKPQIDYLDYSHDEAQFGYYFMFNEGDVYAWTEKELTEDELTIYRRFTTVISLTYKRYKDLQQAEAQAREAKIEAGLERVRARTMAMHSSEDVSIATATMFTELEKLGIENLRGGITIIKAGDKQEVWSVTNLPDGRIIRSIGEFDMHLHALWRELLKAKLNNGDYNYYRLAGKDKEDYINILNATPNYLSQPIKDFPDVHVQSYFFGEGAIWTNSLQPHSEEDKQVMKRFASVFSLTFRRYQDLQKAEAQAREATIEASLERVRGKAMAMHSSKDLATTIGVFYHELEGLDLTPRRCGVGLISKETKMAEISTMNASADGEGIEMVGNLDLKTHPVLTSVYNNWLTKTEYHPVLRGHEIKEYYQIVRPQIAFPDYPDDTVQYGYFFFFEEGGVYAWTEKELNEEELKIYRRFTSVLSLTYKRYKDLKDAEARTLAAIKDAALDRIRADIASMRTINDLDRITPLIWNELTILGIPFIRCGVFIIDEEQQLIHTFLSTPDGKAIAAFHLPYDTPGNLAHVVANWKESKKYIDHWDESEFKQFAEILMKQGALASSEQYLKTIPKGGFYLHFLPFLQGMLYVGNTDQLKEEEIELIQHVADAFSTAYARYEDFNKLEAAKQQVEKTLTDLKQAQTQLVQSEKMASLGEMTAGIAHEIQNPLNFVNNFSEVSKELLDEMKTELETGNTEDAKDIADDVIQNLEKINHHGKRADAIVKSMLQHSRSSNGKKEPADINGLADEYLRLAYHGLRAKDKSFNAKFETEFDNNIGKINIISQDIGRVLVNLINNAFYAVSERKRQESNGYEPTVTVYTKKIDDKIEIKVKDNGNGIPQKVLDKIFQPFFTTKPTGQGTGLGLSLAYDIVTKGHGGELKVKTKEGEGSEFIIQLSAT